MNFLGLLLLSTLSCSNLVVGHSLRIEESTCPQVYSKSESECAGRSSDCWSPGQLDVDCNNGQALCCFDGCANSCVKDRCAIFTEVRQENVTKEMCRVEPRDPICSKETLEDCHNSCQIVDDVIPVEEESEECLLVKEKVCNDVSKEVCDFQDNISGQCPVLPALSADQCAGEAPSDCWSPGLPDVDCPNNGLCCFNGCFNRCYNNCEIVVSESCTEVPVEECKDTLERECQDVSMTIDVPVTKTVCTVEKKSCFSMASADEFLNMVDVERCVDGKEVCFDEASTKQENIIFNKCLIVPRKECFTVPKKTCRSVSEEVCKKCELRTITEKQCYDEPKTVCTKTTRIVEKTVPKEVCSKQCVPRIVEKCIPSEPERICQNVVKTMSYNIPVRRCF